MLVWTGRATKVQEKGSDPIRGEVSESIYPSVLGFRCKLASRKRRRLSVEIDSGVDELKAREVYKLSRLFVQASRSGLKLAGVVLVDECSYRNYIDARL